MSVPEDWNFGASVTCTLSRGNYVDGIKSHGRGPVCFRMSEVKWVYGEKTARTMERGLEEKGERREEGEGACERGMALIYLPPRRQMQLAGHRGWAAKWSHMCWCWCPSEYRRGSVEGCGRVLGTKEQRVRLGCEAPLPAGSRYLAPPGRGTHCRQEG